MANSRVLRPAPITASAVLLIVTGSQLVLGAAAGLVWICVDVLVTRLPQVPILACLCGLVLLTARDLLNSGVRLLRGTFRTSREVTERHQFHRALALLGSVVAAILCVRAFITSPRDQLMDWLTTTAGGLTAAAFWSFWLNTAALVLACRLAARHAAGYARWRESSSRMADEPDDES